MMKWYINMKKHNPKHVPALLSLFALAISCLTLGSGLAATSGNSSGKQLPIYCVDTDKPYISISFDAAWGNEDTAHILESLEKNDVHAHIFLNLG